LLFRQDIVKTFSGETVRKLRALWLIALGILVWTVAFAGCSGSNSLTVTLAPASGESLNPGATVTITATVAHDKNNQGVTWTLTGPGSLSGNTTTSVVYTAPSTISVSTSATITATSVGNSSVTATESISLTAVLTITTSSLPAGALLVPYGPAFVNATGATGTFTWTLTAGTLPPGLTFLTTSTSSSAEIMGTPTALGTSRFSVQVTDSAGTSVTQALSITINPPPPLSVVTASLPPGMVNSHYSQNLLASSGVQPYTWSLAGNTLLPLGLSLAPDGVISGTPIVTGTFNFTVEVSDSSTPAHQTATANLSITINPGLTNNARLSGNYAFSVRGFDGNGLFVAAGSFAADGNGNISSGIMDTNDTVNVLANQTFTGAYSIGQNGLGFLTFNITSVGTGSRTFALSMMADGNANMIEFDDSTGGGTRNSGVVLKQEAVTFSTGSYAFGFVGIDSNKNRFGMAGEFQASAGLITGGQLDTDSISSASGSIPITGGAYSVAPNGRGTATITAQSTTTYNFYVVTPTELLVIGIDPFAGGNPLVSGTMIQQSSNGSFTNANFNGPSVFEVTALEGSTAESQIGVFDGSGANGQFNLTSDQNTGGTLTSPCSGTGTQCAPGTDTVAPSGRVTLTDSGFQNSKPPNISQPVLYLVTSNQAFIIGTDTAVSFGFMTPQSGPFSAASLSGTYAGGSLAPVDPSVSNVVSIAIAGSNTLNVTADVSNANGLSQGQIVGTTTVPDTHGRVVVTENGNTEAGILYLISPSQYFSLVGSGDATARVDMFAQ
jgi:hypothetical protein